VTSVSLEALDGAVAHCHGGIKLVKAEHDVDVVGEDGSSGLAVGLRMARVASGVGGCRVKNGKNGKSREKPNWAHDNDRNCSCCLQKAVFGHQRTYSEVLGGAGLPRGARRCGHRPAFLLAATREPCMMELCADFVAVL
jgi:hypothetical protein